MIGLDKPNRAFYYTAMLLGLFACIFMQGSRGILETTEGRYTECARETLASGNPLEPLLNGEHHWTKPPLTYWAIGAGTVLFGNTPWGARAYLVVAFLLTIIAVQFLDSALWKRPSSGLAALVFATSPIAIAASNTVATDALLTLWEALAFAFYWQAVRTEKRMYTTLMWLTLGLAVATKGPVGLLPLTAIFPAQFLMRRRGYPIRSLFTIEGLILFAAVGLSWYIYVIWRYPEVLRDWIGIEIVGRLQYDAHHRLSSQAHKVVTNYLPIMLLGTGPWLAWLLWYRRTLLRRDIFRALLKDYELGPEHSFLIIAVVVQFVLFSFSTSRMPLYLVPLFVPMSVAIGRGLGLLLEGEIISRNAILRMACATALTMALVKGAASFQGTWKNMTDIAAVLRDVPEIRDGTPITALFRAPLNGLQFHLDRRIPTIYFKVDNPELLKQAATDDGLLPSVIAVANADLFPTTAAGRAVVPSASLVIVRSKDLAMFGPFFEPFGLRVMTKSDHWTLLRVDVPIEVTEIEAASPIEDRS